VGKGRSEPRFFVASVGRGKRGAGSPSQLTAAARMMKAMIAKKTLVWIAFMFGPVN
jgi:hypothetical protein